MTLSPYEMPQLISGSQPVKAIGVEIFSRSEKIKCIADDVFSLSFEALNGGKDKYIFEINFEFFFHKPKGNHAAFHEKIHEVRLQKGQIQTCHDICLKIKENVFIANIRLFFY